MKHRLLDENKDMRRGWVIVAGVALLAIKLVLCSAQKMYLLPSGAPDAASRLDDMLMYDLAVSISQGKWLGAYSWLNLSKHSFFALWVAVLHWLKIPYLLGGQLLWGGAALAGAWALAPVLKKRWLALGLYAVLLFNPASVANGPQGLGFTLRVYRDNIFPALCLLVVAGMVGFALRWQQRPGKSIGWLVVAGLALAACVLCREDGWWLLPFVLAAAGITLVFIWRGDKGKRLRRSALLLVPFVLLGAGEAAWRGANYAHYGRFIVSDFSSGEFADAYGAMTRVTHENWDPQVAVPRDVRQKLYAAVPAFAELAPVLEDEAFQRMYTQPGGDYNSGSFYWALREAAAQLGYYDTPQAAQAYFAGLARDINAACDNGTLDAGPRRSSVSPPIKSAYVGPVLKEMGKSLVFCATFQQCDARSLFSPGSNDPALYAAEYAPMEEFLHDTAQTATIAGSDAPYFSLFGRLCFAVFDVIRWVYAVLLPLGLLAALAWQVLAGLDFIRRLRKREKDSAASLLWFIQLGLLFCILLRAAMIAFVSVASFGIGTYVMYLASVHPLMLLYAFVGVTALVRRVLRRKDKAAAQAGEAG